MCPSQQDPRFVALGDADSDPLAASRYDGIVAVTKFASSGAVSEVRLYPVDMRQNDPMSSRGIPRLATGDRARAILRQVQRDSKQYGTRIQIKGGMGIVQP